MKENYLIFNTTSFFLLKLTKLTTKKKNFLIYISLSLFNKCYFRIIIYKLISTKQKDFFKKNHIYT